MTEEKKKEPEVTFEEVIVEAASIIEKWAGAIGNIAKSMVEEKK